MQGKRVLTSDQRDDIRSRYRASVAARKRMAEIDDQILDLMDAREQLVRDIDLGGIRALAKEFGVSRTTIVYIVRARGTEIV